ncbi:MAG: AP2 domain-containing protein [Bacilli bacterium]
MNNEEIRLINKKNKIGEVVYNKFGSKVRILDYIDKNNIAIIFDEYNDIYENVKYINFKNGSVKSSFEPRVFDIGFLGDKNIDLKKYKKQYSVWRCMLNRCYNEKDRVKYSTYKDVTVCDEWLNFQNFAKWYEENYYEVNDEKMCLDKDILIKGNKIYSPQTCIFAPQRINKLFIKSDKIRGICPIGVYEHGEKFQVSLKFTPTFDDMRSAFLFYKINKEMVIQCVADEYIGLIPQILYNTMYKYEVEYDD